MEIDTVKNNQKPKQSWNAWTAPRVYYILSLKWTKQRDENATWWRPDSAGYTTDLDLAGVYTEKQVVSESIHYNNGTDTLAVPVEIARNIARTTVDAGTIKGLMSDRKKSSARVS